MLYRCFSEDCLYIWWAWARKDITPLSGNLPDSMSSLAILVFISVFAFSFWFIALQSKGAKVSDINMCRLINPILGAVLSWIMLPGEYPTFSTVAGMVVIVSSLIIYFKGTEISEWFKKTKAGIEQTPANIIVRQISVSVHNKH